MKIKERYTNKIGTLLLVIAALLGFACMNQGEAFADPVTIQIWAKTGLITLPNGATPTSVTIWGYSNDSTAPPTLPGPTWTVNQGDVVTVTLTNNLPEATALLFPGQDMIPDTAGAASGGGTATYTFTANRPGTFLYEAGLIGNAQHQTAMGLYGALIVRPTAGPPPGFNGKAYGAATTAFHDEAVVLLSEIDPALNNSATPAGFDMRNFAPKYSLINGKAHPETALIIPAFPGSGPVTDRVLLLRYLNAGIQHHSMTLLGLTQTVVANDGSPLQYSHRMAAETIAPGQTADVLATVPASAAAGGQYPLYDGSLQLFNNRAAGFGGMLTLVGTPLAPVTVGPVTGTVGLTANPTNGTVDVVVSAPIGATGGAEITGAEYFIDAKGANGSGVAMTASGAPPATATGTITASQLSSLSSGNHTIYVHGQDASGWGAANFAVLNLDKSGPKTTGLSLTPNPSNGTVDIALSGTGDDSTTGNGNIAGAEYFIGTTGAPGSGTSMTVAPAGSTIAVLSASIPAATVAALPAGSHLVSVRSRDALGNWGAFATISLQVAIGGPTTSGVVATPSPNNGALPLNSSAQVVRISAGFTSSLAAVVAAEGFIDTIGANGAGFQFAATDGLFNSTGETGIADIPLSTIAQLAVGTHTIYVHGRDASGNWGTHATGSLVIDKAAPTVSGLTLTPVASNNTAVAVSATASDIATGNSNIASGEFFIDTAGVNGTGTVMTAAAAAPSTTIGGTIPAATVSALAAGNHIVYVHARDAAGNWGVLVSATLLIDRTPPTFSGITVAPNPTNGAASVTLTVNGAGDGAGGSGVAGGEYWFGTINPAPGGGTAFTGLSAIIPVGSLTPGSYTVRARIRDVAGNWSTGAGGVRSATLTVVPDAIFSNGFEAGNFSGWTSTSTANTTRLSVTAGSALAGAFGMQAQGNNTNYAQYTFSPSAGTYDARFYFQPNANASAGHDIFAAATSSGFGTILFHVRYRLNAGQSQVQIQVGGAANATWTNINSGAANVIEMVWQSGSTLQLYVNSVLSQTLTASAGSVGSVRMGSVTNGGSNILEYFDAFASKRSTSPLLGP